MSRRLGLALKRAFDVVVAAAALVVLSPLMLLVAAAVRVALGSPVLFRQPRLGRDGRVFTLLKFRTMTDARDDDGRPLPDARRLTRLGRFLRAATLDELPEVLNVLRGDMSIVGPRPLLVEYRELYSPRQWRRHEMRPGMAGPVVAAGRNTLSWEEKFELDVRYVEEWSLARDFAILGRAIGRVVTGHGVAAPGHATMPRFEGAGAGDAAGDAAARPAADTEREEGRADGGS